MASIAKRVREEAGLPVASVWGFRRSDLAESAIRNEQLDLVMIGGAHLENPHWPYHAAKTLNVNNPSWVLPAPHTHWIERYTL